MDGGPCIFASKCLLLYVVITFLEDVTTLDLWVASRESVDLAKTREN